MESGENEMDLEREKKKMEESKEKRLEERGMSWRKEEWVVRNKKKIERSEEYVKRDGIR